MKENTLEILHQQAIATRQRAYAPYSQYLVGACLETNSGQIYAGCNVENAAYGLTVCAESNAIAAMVADGAREIKRIAVVVDDKGPAIPCGACRQKISEFSQPETEVHLYNLQGAYRKTTVGELLPHAFGPANLNR